MDLIINNIKLRAFTVNDAIILANLINNCKITDNLRDYIPFPYAIKDAETYIDQCKTENPQVTFAIEYQNKFVGSIGLVRQCDVYRKSAEIGYWIGETYWGKGITTEAVKLITDYGFCELGLARIYSGVFSFNKASQRVLEKAGYKLECISEKAIFKNQKLCDEYRYSIINPDLV